MTPHQQRILDLRDELNRHNHNYYVLNAPEISDQDFDMLMKELEALEAEHPDMDDPLSPTHRVGERPHRRLRTGETHSPHAVAVQHLQHRGGGRMV